MSVTKIWYKDYNNETNTYSEVKSIEAELSISQWIFQNMHRLIISAERKGSRCKTTVKA